MICATLVCVRRITAATGIAPSADSGDEEDFRVALRQYLPDADGSLLALRTCLYTNTPDEDFIVDAHPQHPRVSIACGFSGHGFKFASVIGEMLADRVAGKDSAYPVEFLKLRRFAPRPG